MAWRPKQYDQRDASAQQERLLANFLNTLDLSSISTMEQLTRAEAEFVAEALVRGGWILIPGVSGRLDREFGQPLPPPRT